MKTTLHAWMLTVLALTAGGQAMATEEAKFEVISQAGPIELRRYPALIVSETWVEGDMDAASNQGFRQIADYIFGNNQAAGAANDKASAKIAMTAPVTIEPVQPAEKIAMTAPVTIEPLDDSTNALMDAKRWRIHFVMPSQYTLATLPKPNNPAVTLREVPGKTWAVLTYSGFNTVSRVQARTDELLAWVASQKLQAVGSPQLARYNPPWTLPMWRRNEIMLEVTLP
jgi:hypothetical protein